MLITGGGALSAGIAAALSQCGRNVRVEQSHAGSPDLGIEKLTVWPDGNTPLCHAAVNGDGACWSFGGGHGGTPAPLTAFRRAAALRAAPCPGTPGTPMSDASFATIAAQQIAHSILRAGQARPPAGTVTFLDRRTLRTSVHNVTGHPFDMPAEQQAKGGSRQDRGEPGNSLPSGRETLTERWRRLSDDRFGAFAELDDTKLRQLPLKVTLARLSDPGCLLSATPAVVGAGIDRGSARERVMLQALAAYGSIMVDPRLLAGGNGAFLGPPEADATGLLRAVRDGSVAAFVRATDLTSGHERLVPAHQAFPVLREPTLGRTPCGTSAALDWRQALTHGLLQHCVRLTVSGSPSPARPPAVLAAEDFTQDPAVRYLAAMAKAAGWDPALYGLTGPAGVPVVACTMVPGETVYAGGARLADAVREALTAALFRYQQRCDPLLRSAASAGISPACVSPAGLASLNPEKLVQALTALGYTPSVFALDHDRTVHDAFPCVLRVTLSRVRAG